MSVGNAFLSILVSPIICKEKIKRKKIIKIIYIYMLIVYSLKDIIEPCH